MIPLVVSLLLILAIAAPAESQVAVEARQVDLAAPSVADTALITSGRYQISIVNRLPLARYSVAVNIVAVAIPPLDVPVPRTAGADPCADLRTAVANLKTAQRESDIPRLLRAYELARDDARARGLDRRQEDGGGEEDVPDEDGDQPPPPSCAALLVAGDKLHAGTRMTVEEVYAVSEGEAIVVTVVRLDETGGAAQQWRKVYTTGPSGTWRVTYGFAFPVVSGLSDEGVFSDQDRHFTRSVEGGRFVIEEGRDNESLDAVPTILYSFLPRRDAGFHWNPLTAGVGIDLSNPMVLLGTGWTYNANLQLDLGLSARHERGLLSKYSEGDTLATELTDDQLTEDVIKLRPFVAVTFRFASNPFASGQDGTKPASPEEKPDTAGGGPTEEKPDGGTEEEPIDEDSPDEDSPDEDSPDEDPPT